MKKKLSSIHSENLKYTAIIERFSLASPMEYDVLIATYWTHFDKYFIERLDYLIAEAYDESDARKENSLRSLKLKIIVWVESYSDVVNDIEVMRNAFDRFHNFFDGLSTIEDIELSIHKKLLLGRVDPAKMLSVSKAYSSVLESPYSRTEIAELVSHLYIELQKQKSWNTPIEIKILRHLMKIEDTFKFYAELERSVMPGSNLESRTHDYLWSTTARLLRTIDMSLKTIHELKKKKKSIIKETDCVRVVEKLMQIKEKTLNVANTDFL
eukprot:gnl/MRDRNA2_/MRDRNA2_83207_c2_seq1.p1 gnl/MRDRNA2_/MRDRNA2_83207_c2~~gnl/MRDRNA2_/MRDRNA2_83207_c2_seq1.p1  ORF type:complete len:268 (+),score=15.92 gnl/MRDRNA2_/MRDRNA2_83207_c2_seq1:129-932(+)